MLIPFVRDAGTKASSWLCVCFHPPTLSCCQWKSLIDSPFLPLGESLCSDGSYTHPHPPPPSSSSPTPTPTPTPLPRQKSTSGWWGVNLPSSAEEWCGAQQPALQALQVSSAGTRCGSGDGDGWLIEPYWSGWMKPWEDIVAQSTRQFNIFLVHKELRSFQQTKVLDVDCLHLRQERAHAKCFGGIGTTKWFWQIILLTDILEKPGGETNDDSSPSPVF